MRRLALVVLVLSGGCTAPAKVRELREAGAQPNAGVSGGLPAQIKWPRLSGRR
jgi:hypothetical protein